MRRRKRFTIFRITLALAVAAIVPVTAQAKPSPTVGNDVRAQYQLGPGEIPYLSQGHGVDAAEFGLTVGPTDRKPARAESALAQERIEIPYLSQGVGVTSAELGFAVGKSPDDRSFARAPTLDTTQVVSDGGTSIDVNPYAVTGFGLAMLLAMGMGVGIWQSRKARLSPA